MLLQYVIFIYREWNQGTPDIYLNNDYTNVKRFVEMASYSKLKTNRENRKHRKTKNQSNG